MEEPRRSSDWPNEMFKKFKLNIEQLLGSTEVELDKEGLEGPDNKLTVIMRLMTKIQGYTSESKASLEERQQPQLSLVITNATEEYPTESNEIEGTPI